MTIRHYICDTVYKYYSEQDNTRFRTLYVAFQLFSTQSNKYLHANPVQMHTLAHQGRLLCHLLLHLQSSLEAMMHSYLLEEVVMILDKERLYLPGSILLERESILTLFCHTFHTTFACYHYSSYENYSLCFVLPQ